MQQKLKPAGSFLRKKKLLFHLSANKPMEIKKKKKRKKENKRKEAKVNRGRLQNLKKKSRAHHHVFCTEALYEVQYPCVLEAR